MRKILFGLALAVMLAPLAVSAEPTPSADGGPPPEVRAKLDAARADAKVQLIKALSPDHLAKIQADIDQFNAGTLAPIDTMTAIDAILSPDEAKAVIAIQANLNQARRALLPPGGGAGPGGTPGAMGTPNPGEAPRNQLNAGRTVLQLLASPEKLRSLMRRPG
jgi:hypothetical protein